MKRLRKLSMCDDYDYINDVSDAVFNSDCADCDDYDVEITSGRVPDVDFIPDGTDIIEV